MTRIETSPHALPSRKAHAPAWIGLDATSPAERDPAQWMQATGLARQACARIFRDGGSPTDAVRAFGIEPSASMAADWSRAVHVIAESLCTSPLRRAA